MVGRTFIVLKHNF